VTTPTTRHGQEADGTCYGCVGQHWPCDAIKAEDALSETVEQYKAMVQNWADAVARADKAEAALAKCVTIESATVATYRAELDKAEAALAEAQAGHHWAGLDIFLAQRNAARADAERLADALTFARNRLVHIYGESPNIDFILTMGRALAAHEKLITGLSTK